MSEPKTFLATSPVAGILVGSILLLVALPMAYFTFANLFLRGQETAQRQGAAPAVIAAALLLFAAFCVSKRTYATVDLQARTIRWVRYGLGLPYRSVTWGSDQITEIGEDSRAGHSAIVLRYLYVASHGKELTLRDDHVSRNDRWGRELAKTFGVPYVPTDDRGVRQRVAGQPAAAAGPDPGSR